MNPDELRELSENGAVIVGFLLAVCTLAVQTKNFLFWLKRRIDVYLRRRRGETLIIKPSLEELAKYSVKLPQPSEPEEVVLLRREASFRNLERTEREQRILGRMLVLMLCFSFAFAFLAVFYLWVLV